jgi:hypothetical protein
MTNHFESPGIRKEKAPTATTVILHCNYRIEAPFIVQLDFAEDNFMQGGIVLLPDVGTTNFGPGFKQGKILVATVNAPSLPTQDLVTVFVLGTTDQPPRAIRYAIESK